LLRYLSRHKPGGRRRTGT